MSWGILLLLTVLLISLWVVKKLHFSHKDCDLTERLLGKLAIVTGGNQGIGVEIVCELARRGARVIMASRDLEKAEAVKSQLFEKYGKVTRYPYDLPPQFTPIFKDQIVCEELDLNSPSSIRSFVKRVMSREKVLDILINNAAVNYSEPKFGPDGLEAHLKVNHLAAFLLTNALKPLLEKSLYPSRVINVSSFNHRLAELNVKDLCRPLVGSAYSNSKLANVIHAREIARRWAPQIVAVSVHPGLVKTELFRHMPVTRWVVHTLLGWLAKTPRQGAQTIIYCAVTDDLIPGAHYSECRVTKVNPQALNRDVGEALWKESQYLVRKWEMDEWNKSS